MVKAEKYPPPQDPALNAAHVDDDGDLYTWDGAQWVPYQDIPEGPLYEPAVVFGFPARKARGGLHVHFHVHLHDD